jgi:hypothetical protein
MIEKPKPEGRAGYWLLACWLSSLRLEPCALVIQEPDFRMVFEVFPEAHL